MTMRTTLSVWGREMTTLSDLRRWKANEQNDSHGKKEHLESAMKSLMDYDTSASVVIYAGGMPFMGRTRGYPMRNISIHLGDDRLRSHHADTGITPFGQWLLRQWKRVKLWKEPNTFSIMIDGRPYLAIHLGMWHGGIMLQHHDRYFHTKGWK